MEENECSKMADHLQRYVPYLLNLMQQLKDPKQSQLKKLETLYSMITDRKRKLTLDTLKKCEDVVLKVLEKAYPNAFKDTKYEQKHKLICKNPPVSSSEVDILSPDKPEIVRNYRHRTSGTPESFKPSKKLRRHSPIVITPEVIKRRKLMSCKRLSELSESESSYIKKCKMEKPDVYRKTTESLNSASSSSSNTFVFNDLRIRVDMSEYPLRDPPVQQNPFDKELQDFRKLVHKKHFYKKKNIGVNDLRHKLLKNKNINIKLEPIKPLSVESKVIPCKKIYNSNSKFDGFSLSINEKPVENSRDKRGDKDYKYNKSSERSYHDRKEKKYESDIHSEHYHKKNKERKHKDYKYKYKSQDKNYHHYEDKDDNYSYQTSNQQLDGINIKVKEAPVYKYLPDKYKLGARKHTENISQKVSSTENRKNYKRFSPSPSESSCTSLSSFDSNTTVESCKYKNHIDKKENKHNKIVRDSKHRHCKDDKSRNKNSDYYEEKDTKFSHKTLHEQLDDIDAEIKYVELCAIEDIDQENPVIETRQIYNHFTVLESESSLSSVDSYAFDNSTVAKSDSVPNSTFCNLLSSIDEKLPSKSSAKRIDKSRDLESDKNSKKDYHVEEKERKNYERDAEHETHQSKEKDYRRYKEKDNNSFNPTSIQQLDIIKPGVKNASSYKCVTDKYSLSSQKDVEFPTVRDDSPKHSAIDNRQSYNYFTPSQSKSSLLSPDRNNLNSSTKDKSKLPSTVTSNHIDFSAPISNQLISPQLTDNDNIYINTFILQKNMICDQNTVNPPQNNFHNQLSNSCTPMHNQIPPPSINNQMILPQPVHNQIFSSVSNAYPHEYDMSKTHVVNTEYRQKQVVSLPPRHAQYDEVQSHLLVSDNRNDNCKPSTSQDQYKKSQENPYAGLPIHDLRICADVEHLAQTNKNPSHPLQRLQRKSITDVAISMNITSQQNVFKNIQESERPKTPCEKNTSILDINNSSTREQNDDIIVIEDDEEDNEKEATKLIVEESQLVKESNNADNIDILNASNINSIIENLLAECDTTILEAFVETLAVNKSVASDNKFKRVRLVIDSDSDEDSSKNKSENTRKEDILEDTDDTDESETSEVSISESEESSEVEENNTKRKKCVKRKSKLIDKKKNQKMNKKKLLELKTPKTTEITETIGERTKKRCQRYRTELDKLHEDIKEMFIRDGVLTANGKRICQKSTQANAKRNTKKSNKFHGVLSKAKDKESILNSLKHQAIISKPKVIIEKMDLSKFISKSVIIIESEDEEPSTSNMPSNTKTAIKYKPNYVEK